MLDCSMAATVCCSAISKSGLFLNLEGPVLEPPQISWWSTAHLKFSYLIIKNHMICKTILFCQDFDIFIASQVARSVPGVL